MERMDRFTVIWSIRKHTVSKEAGGCCVNRFQLCEVLSWSKIPSVFRGQGCFMHIILSIGFFIYIPAISSQE